MGNVVGHEYSETLDYKDMVTDGTDWIWGFGGDDHIFARGGNDYILGGWGADTIDGGDGTDTAVYYDSLVGVGVVLTSTGGFGFGGTADGDTLISIENLVGSWYGDYLAGNDGRNDLNGSAGDDILKGGGGVDMLDGGDDVYVIALGISFYPGGNDILKGGGGGDTLNGGNGIDTAAYNDSPAGVYVSLRMDDAWGGDATDDELNGIENLRGSAHADTLEGDDANANVLEGMDGDDHLWGYDGADRLDGGTGSDDMHGGRGSDTYVVDRYEDTVLESGGEGSDTVYARSSWAMTWGSDIERLEAFDPNSTAYMFLGGNNSANTIVGNHGDNFIDGGGGADVLIGLGGNDSYHVDHAVDAVIEAEGAGNDTVFATVSYTLPSAVEDLQAYNESLLDPLTLTGNELINTVRGNNGNNVINGGDNNDYLVGLGGQDAFLFNTALREVPDGAIRGNVDMIEDFNVADDTIQLDRDIFPAIGSLGSVAGSQFVIGTAALDASDRIIYDNVSGAVYYDPDGTTPGGAAQIQFATLNPGLALTNFDFFVVP